MCRTVLLLAGVMFVVVGLSCHFVPMKPQLRAGMTHAEVREVIKTRRAMSGSWSLSSCVCEGKGDALYGQGYEAERDWLGREWFVSVDYDGHDHVTGWKEEGMYVSRPSWQDWILKPFGL